MSFDDFLEAADFAVIDDAYRRAGRAISPDLATSYSGFLAKSEGGNDDLEAALFEARVTVAALGPVPEVKEYLDAEAEKLATKWAHESTVSRSRVSLMSAKRCTARAGR